MNKFKGKIKIKREVVCMFIFGEFSFFNVLIILFFVIDLLCVL